MMLLKLFAMYAAPMDKAMPKMVAMRPIHR